MRINAINAPVMKNSFGFFRSSLHCCLLSAALLLSLLLFPEHNLSAHSWDSPSVQKLMNSGFEADFNMKLVSKDKSKRAASGSIIFFRGKFKIKSGSYSFVFDGKSLYTIDSHSKEIVISPLDNLEDFLLSIAGARSTVDFSFSGDNLKSISIKTEDGTAYLFSVPSFRYLSEDYFAASDYFIVNLEKKPLQSYYITDLR